MGKESSIKYITDTHYTRLLSGSRVLAVIYAVIWQYDTRYHNLLFPISDTPKIAPHTSADSPSSGPGM